MIVCGVDFSQHSDAAARGAASMARQFGLPLALVHVAEPVPAGGPSEEPALALLRQRSAALASEFGISVVPHFERGAADATLVALARSLDARLLVVAALGQRKQHQWLLGSTAERVAQSSSIPTLVVREGLRIEAWARGERTLGVLVGVELTPTSRAALQWASALRAVGPCSLRVARIVRPAEEHQSRGIAGPIALDHLQPELEALLLLELEQWAGVDASGETTFLVQPGWGRIDSHLTLLASESQADLLVVGTHQRAGIARLWQGSVSRAVLHDAAMSVACVPPGWGAGSSTEAEADTEVDGDD